MNQSSFIAGVLLAGFILFLAANNRLGVYLAVLWGTPPNASTSSQNAQSSTANASSSTNTSGGASTSSNAAPFSTVSGALSQIGGFLGAIETATEVF